MAPFGSVAVPQPFFVTDVASTGRFGVPASGIGQCRSCDLRYGQLVDVCSGASYSYELHREEVKFPLSGVVRGQSPFRLSNLEADFAQQPIRVALAGDDSGVALDGFREVIRPLADPPIVVALDCCMD